MEKQTPSPGLGSNDVKDPALYQSTVTEDEVSSLHDQGTAQDAKDMYRLGKKQRLQRNFQFIPILSFSCALITTWEVSLSTANFGLLNGGIAGLVWVTLATYAFSLLYVIVLAQMASMAPTPGGQYHWVSEFAPRQYQKIASYTVGWLCTMGWSSGVASTGYLSALQIQGLAVLNNPDYVPQRWHASLIIIAISLISLSINTLGLKRLPPLEVAMTTIHLVGGFAFFITMFSLPGKNPSNVMVGEFYNGGGWPSIGTACIVGQLGQAFSAIGSDCVVHLAEEVRDASYNVPRAMVLSSLLNSTIGFLSMLAFAFHIHDVSAVLKTPTGFPLIQVVYDATKSKPATNVFMVILILMSTISTSNVLAVGSRQTFAFARDKGLPFSTSLARVTHLAGAEVPLNAILFCLVITVIIALINIGSTAAFNSVVSLLNVSLMSAYAISIACLLYRQAHPDGLKQTLPPTRWRLGKAAVPMGVVAMMYCAFVTVMSFFPLTAIVDAKTMNWSVLVYGVVVGFALAAYFVGGRNVYDGPVVYIRDVINRRGEDGKVRNEDGRAGSEE